MAKSRARQNGSGRKHANTALGSEYATAMHGLRTSNASGKHKDRRTKRNRTRSAQKHNAINAGW